MHSKILLFLYFCVQITFALTLPFNQRKGSSSFQILKLDLSPQTIAWSGSGVAHPRSLIFSSIDLNPVISLDTHSQIGFSQTYPSTEFKAQVTNLAFSLNHQKKSFFSSIRSLGFYPIEGFDDFGESVTSYQAYALKIQSGYGYKWTQKLHSGISLSYVLNNIERFFYHTFILDLGFRYQILQTLFIGGSITNADLFVISPQNDIFSPTTLQVGIFYSYIWSSKFNTDLLFDIQTSTDQKISFPVGISLNLYEWFSFRFGKSILNTSTKSSLGSGLQFSSFNFDYSTQIHNSLSVAHSLSLSFKF